jgi:ribose 5-phosphate isomerase B
MRIALAADHAGYLLKDELAAWLREAGHEVTDLGTNGPESVDYPEYGASLANAIANGQAERGIVVCGSGIGISIAVNRNPACRCARVSDPLSAQLAREHNDANVLALGARLIGSDMARGLRGRVPRHRFRRRAPPAPRRPAFQPPPGIRLMATAPDLTHVQPLGFFHRRLADADPRSPRRSRPSSSASRTRSS